MGSSSSIFYPSTLAKLVKGLDAQTLNSGHTKSPSLFVSCI